MDVLENLSISVSDTNQIYNFIERALQNPQEVINTIGQPIIGQITPLNLRLALLRIELLIGLNQLRKAESELSALQLDKLSASVIESSPDLTLIRDDLLVDLHYANSGKFLEMVHKKLNLVNNSKASPKVRAAVYKKLLELTLLEGPVFLKGKILSHIEAAFNIDHSATQPLDSANDNLARELLAILTPESKVLFSKHFRRQPIPMTDYEAFLRVSTYTEPKDVIYSNYLQNNISFLSKYYDSMSFDSLRLLFAVPECIDLEVLVAEMIASQKLPLGTLVGQAEKIFYFKIAPTSATENELARRLRICGLVDQITELIEQASK